MTKQSFELFDYLHTGKQLQEQIAFLGELKAQ